ncbi:MAG: hypothetical protein WBG95_15570 [Sulfitobacter sp.]
MMDTMKKLEISQTEMDLIEAALETQAKILRMQASAGGHGAREQLNEVKRVLATVASQRDTGRAATGSKWGAWFRTAGEAV